MGLETGTGIGDLVPTNPLSTDAVSSGDDHIRLIKTVMQSITFLKSIQTFTASGTWTRPANVKKVIIYCLGGGGGGNGGALSGYSGGGGSSGGIAIKWLDVTAISTATIGIGAGGVGGAAGGLGSSGTATAFSTAGPVYHCVGREGSAGSGFNANGGVAAATNLNSGDILFAGGDGANGMYFQPAGATTFGGIGGGSGANTSGGNARDNSGGGGVGGAATAAAGGAGGNGGSGYCIILEFGW